MIEQALDENRPLYLKQFGTNEGDEPENMASWRASAEPVVCAVRAGRAGGVCNFF